MEERFWVRGRTEALGRQVREGSAGLGGKRCHLGPHTYAWYNGQTGEIVGKVGVHVDDVRMTGNEEWFPTVWQKPKELYEWAEWEGVQSRCTGVTYKGEVSKWASLDMEHYTSHRKPIDMKWCRPPLGAQSGAPRAFQAEVQCSWPCRSPCGGRQSAVVRHPGQAGGPRQLNGGANGRGLAACGGHDAVPLG